MTTRTLGTEIGRRERSLAAAPGARAIGLKRRFEPDRYAFIFGASVIIIVFLLPGSFLGYLGLYSYEAGGSPLTKFHPATYLAVLAAWFALYGGRRVDGGVISLFLRRPALAWSGGLLVACIAYSIYFVGISGMAVYIDTYLAAILTAIALDRASPRQRRILGYTILALCVANVLLAVYEVRMETHLLPQPELDTLENNQTDIQEPVTEFRGYALWAHPLTGALATSLAAFLVVGMGMPWWRIVVFLGVFVIGLLAYGGRGALVTTVLLVVSASLFQLASGLMTRRLNVGFACAFVAGVLLLPALFSVVTNTTHLGSRVMTHMYLDESAEVRIVQWRVLNYLTLRDALVGVPLERIDKLKQQVGLTGAGADIENPWLLTFLGLGAVGFPVLIGSLFLFMWHLGRRANTQVGWLIITAALLIWSTSNSLGRKTVDLVLLAGYMSALGGFKPVQEAEQPETTTTVAPVPSARLTALALAPAGRKRALSDLPQAGRSALR